MQHQHPPLSAEELARCQGGAGVWWKPWTWFMVDPVTKETPIASAWERFETKIGWNDAPTAPAAAPAPAPASVEVPPAADIPPAP